MDSIHVEMICVFCGSTQIKSYDVDEFPGFCPMCGTECSDWKQITEEEFEEL